MKNWAGFVSNIFSTPAVSLFLSTPLAADILWQANFENGNLEGWTYLLNKQGISVSNQHGAEGKMAAKITVKGDADYLWHNKPFLNRVELQHKPQTVKPGGDTFIAWSVMFPELLSDKRHEFAYWESDNSYQQIMRSDIAASKISFKHSQQDPTLWQFNKLLPQVWYDMAMHVHWSDNAQKGQVSVWFDGKKVVNQAPMKTLISQQEQAFIQLAILRDQDPTPETIWLDNVREADDIETLLYR